MQITRHDIARIDERIRALPAGTEMSSRIRSAFAPALNSRSAADECWRQIGEALAFCTNFPARAFRELAVGDDFDIRWPLTFACAYWGASGASVDHECVDYLQNAGFTALSRDCLSDFSGLDWVDDWRTQFSRQLLCV